MNPTSDEATKLVALRLKATTGTVSFQENGRIKTVHGGEIFEVDAALAQVLLDTDTNISRVDLDEAQTSLDALVASVRRGDVDPDRVREALGGRHAMMCPRRLPLAMLADRLVPGEP